MSLRALQALACLMMISAPACFNPQTTVSALNTGNSGLGGAGVSTSAPTATQTSGAPTSANVQLNWNAATGAPSQYFIEGSVDNATFQSIGTVNAPATSAYVTGLYRNQTYYFRIRASNSAGTSGASAVAVVTTPP